MKEEFDRQGCLILRSVIGRGLADFMNGFVRNQAAMGLTDTDTRQVPGAPVGYGAPLMEKILLQVLPAIEAASGRRVYPTYSLYRLYGPGHMLKKHTDRAACEFTLSLCLGYEAPAPWPLFVEGPDGVVRADLNPGDGLLFKGTACRHWREPFEGTFNTQLFLHYVDQDGPHAEWRFDKREGIGARPTGAVQHYVD